MKGEGKGMVWGTKKERTEGMKERMGKSHPFFLKFVADPEMSLQIKYKRNQTVFNVAVNSMYVQLCCE